MEKNLKKIIYQIRSDHLLSHVRLFAIPWIPARQASLSITNSRSSLRLMSIESVMPAISSSVVPFSSCPQSLPIYIKLNHLDVHLKLLQYCKSIIIQLKKSSHHLDPSHKVSKEHFVTVWHLFYVFVFLFSCFTCNVRSTWTGKISVHTNNMNTEWHRVAFK